jgi:membrane-associated protease RseP (regulator of RpoE activity)
MIYCEILTKSQTNCNLQLIKLKKTSTQPRRLSKMRRRWLFILLGILAFLVVFGVGAVVGGLVVRTIPKDERVNPRVFVSTGGFGDGGEGILVSKVEVESPADRSGMARGDILLEVNGTPVDTIVDLQAELAKLNPGDTVNLLAMHGDEERTLSATLGERDGVAYLGIQSGEGAFPGVAVAQPPFGPYEKFVLPHGPGPIIVEPGLKEPGLMEPRWDWLPEEVNQALIVGQVLPDAPAGQAGLQEGDLITKLDGKPVSRPETFTRAIQAYKPGEQITLTVYRRGEDKPLELKVTLAEHPEEAGKGYLGVMLTGFFQKDSSSRFSN